MSTAIKNLEDLLSCTCSQSVNRLPDAASILTAPGPTFSFLHITLLDSWQHKLSEIKLMFFTPL